MLNVKCEVHRRGWETTRLQCLCCERFPTIKSPLITLNSAWCSRCRCCNLQILRKVWDIDTGAWKNRWVPETCVKESWGEKKTKELEDTCRVIVFIKFIQFKTKIHEVTRVLQESHFFFFFLLCHANCDAKLWQSSRRQPQWPNTPKKITFRKRNNLK